MAKDTEDEKKGGLGWVLVFGIGLVLLATVYAWSTRLQKRPEAPALPLVSILIDVKALDQPTRAQIAQLENGIKATGVFGNPLGPAGTKYLLPGAKPGDSPIVKGFEEMTDAEWTAAWSYIAKCEYLIPRMFRLDGTACVIRVDAKQGQLELPPEAAGKLTEALQPFRDKFKGLRVYCKELGLGSAQDRDALNASFGVQLAWVRMRDPETGDGAAATWRTAKGMQRLSQVKGVLAGNKSFRSVTTAASLVRYYWTVALQSEKEVEVSNKDEDVVQALGFARGAGMYEHMSADGRDAVVDTTTSEEGQANVELDYYMSANLQDALKVECRGYMPPVPHKFKGEMTPDTPR